MKFWQALSFSEPDQLLDVSKICEEVGFEGVFLSDHMFCPGDFADEYPYSEDGKLDAFTPETPWPDPWVTIGALAAVTERLKFTTFIYI
ncbi:MAG: LLM class flavin-dependent oxidoreductase, partial [bacterium]|nr:LLM class flavin-dependent oxidoreductase [bacterium]